MDISPRCGVPSGPSQPVRSMTLMVFVDDDDFGCSSSDDELVSSITSILTRKPFSFVLYYIYRHGLTLLLLADTYGVGSRAINASQRCTLPARFFASGADAGFHRPRALIWWHGVAIAWEAIGSTPLRLHKVIASPAMSIPLSSTSSRFAVHGYCETP